MEECLTKQLLLLGASGCLVEKPHCGFADNFGFSFLCGHPEHTKFQAHAAGVLSHEEITARYDALRRNRRDEFTAKLDEQSKGYFP